MGVDGIDKADIFDEYFDDEKPKYIIRNCPCYEGEGAFYNCVNEHIEGDCQDCTDCVLKRIVELCKEVEGIENVVTLYDAAQSGMFLQANRILKLLDIQEVE